MSGPLGAALRRVFLEAIAVYVHLRTLGGRYPALRALRGRRDLRLHLGCGNVVKPGWTNIDIHPAADLRLDLRRPWPFEDASATEIYAEHFLEHLSWPDEVNHFLREAFRVLHPGGTLRISVPDLARHVEAYSRRDEEFRAHFAAFLPRGASTWGDMLNHHFGQQGDHRYSYDVETLVARLSGAGFVNPESLPCSPEYENPARDFESLVICAKRP